MIRSLLSPYHPMTLSPSDDCIFCAIVAGSAPASIVYDDADLLASWISGRSLPATS